MPLRESESIILKTHNLAEADRIVVLFTRDFGMIRGVAKGARRLKSKFGSMLEPFSEIHIEYFEKEDRELVSLEHADLIRSSFNAASNPRMLETYSYLAELLLTFAPPHDPNETLYRMVRAALSVDNLEGDDARWLRLYFEIWILRLGGFLPDWTICSLCRRVFDEAESANLDRAYVLTCGSCHRSRDSVEIVSPAERKIVSDAQLQPPSEFVRARSETGDASGELSNILGRIIEASGGRAPAKGKTAIS